MLYVRHVVQRLTDSSPSLTRVFQGRLHIGLVKVSRSGGQGGWRISKLRVEKVWMKGAFEDSVLQQQ